MSADSNLNPDQKSHAVRQATVRMVKKFKEDMEACSDQLSLVVKAFYLIEKRLEQALEAALPQADRLELKRFFQHWAIWIRLLGHYSRL